MMLKRSGLFSGAVEGVTIERATKALDLIQAQRLVHEVYTVTGYINPDPCHLRVRIFEATALMATFVAKRNGRVIGVLSIQEDSEELGLPSDKAFKSELDALRSAKVKLAEATNQVITEEFRKTAVATELMRCAVAHLTKAGFDEVIAAVSPSHLGFYQLLNFREVGSERSYSDKIEDPVVALSMDINQYRKPASALDDAQHFVHEFMAKKNYFLQMVEGWGIEAEARFLEPTLLRRLFITETGFITQCSDAELRFLERHWGSRTFNAATGRSFFAALNNWWLALLNVLNIRSDQVPVLSLLR